MGNVRTKDIKKISFEMIKRRPEKFSLDFEQNKQAVNEFKLNTTKLIRNKIAGYTTRIMRTRSK